MMCCGSLELAVDRLLLDQRAGVVADVLVDVREHFGEHANRRRQRMLAGLLRQIERRAGSSRRRDRWCSRRRGRWRNRVGGRFIGHAVDRFGGFVLAARRAGKLQRRRGQGDRVISA